METFGFFEQSMLDYFNTQPNVVKGVANSDVEYNKRYLYRIIYSVFDFKLPMDWALNYFRYWLFHFGSIGVIYTNELGWIANPYSVSKIDYQYQPKVIEVTNKELKGIKTGVIGVNAGVVKIFDDFRGLDDLVTHYATKLAEIDKAININLMNANLSKAFSAENKKEAEAIKEAYEKATKGEPFIVVNSSIYNKDRGLVNLFGAVKNDYIVNDLLDSKRTLINEFLTKVGIKNANYDKKERLNSAEVEQNNDETSSIVSVMLENIQASFDKLNKLAPLGLSVKLRYDYTIPDIGGGVQID